MNVLSLFDGMGGAMLALQLAGHHVDTYITSEICPKGNKLVAQHFPNTKQMGSVEHWKEWDVAWDKVDLVIGGSPCQGFSNMGEGRNFKDPRSRLFFTFADIVKHIQQLNPNVKFLLENVRMKSDWKDVISKELQVQPFDYDSKATGPCRRPRSYWMNFKPTIPVENDISWMEVVDGNVTEMTDSWHKWWEINSSRQLAKMYSELHTDTATKGITMTARQYASWNGNFLLKDGEIFKPNQRGLALLAGAPATYLDTVSQRTAEEMTGNGWCLRTVSQLLRGL